MYVYIISLILTGICIYFCNKFKDNKKLRILFLILAMIPFCTISAIRYKVGTDYAYRYLGDFNKMAEGKNVENFEWGFKLLIKLCLVFTKDPQSLFIVTSLIINILIIYIIVKYSENPYLSIAIYLFGGFFFLSLNGVRQFMAMALILFGYRYLFNKKTMPIFVLFLIMAVLLHSSAIVMIILLGMFQKKLFKPKIVIPISIAFLIFGRYMFNILGLVLQNTRFNVYLVGHYAKPEISWLFVVQNLFIYIFYYLMIKNSKKDTHEENLLFNVQALALIITSMESIHMLFNRIAFYFTVFQILSVPYFMKKLEKIEVPDKVILKKINLKKILTKRNIYIFIICCYVLLFIYTNVLHNDNEVIPYRTVFNKKLKMY